MTEKEYEKWCHNLNLVGQDIENYSHKLSSLKDVYNSFNNKHLKLDNIRIEFQYEDTTIKYGSSCHKETYWGFDKKRINKIKDFLESEIKKELREYQSLYESAKNTRTKMIESIKEE